MSEEVIARAQALLDEGLEVEVDAELGRALGAEGIEGDGTTISVSEDEADRAINGFAEKLSLEHAREEILELLNAPYERKLAFLRSEEWVAVAPLPEARRPPSPHPKPPKCVKQCEHVCQDICQEVCRWVCRKAPGGQVYCEPVCRQVCKPVCKQICQIVCS
jgi:hypothetical protein